MCFFTIQSQIKITADVTNRPVRAYNTKFKNAVLIIFEDVCENAE